MDVLSMQQGNRLGFVKTSEFQGGFKPPKTTPSVRHWPFSIKFNSTTLRSHNTELITLPADLRILNSFERGDPGCLHFMLARLIFFGRVTVNPRVVSSDNALEEIVTMNGVQLGE
jgi:hypothetical protein